MRHDFTILKAASALVETIGSLKFSNAILVSMLLHDRKLLDWRQTRHYEDVGGLEGDEDKGLEKQLLYEV